MLEANQRRGAISISSWLSMLFAVAMISGWLVVTTQAAQGCDNNGATFCVLKSKESCEGSLQEIKQRTGSDNPIHGITGVSFRASAFGDIDGDGDPDIFLVDGSGLSISFKYIKNIGSRTNSTFTKQEGTDNPLNGFPVSGSMFLSLELADMDDDGDLDMVMGGGLSGTISYYENIGTLYNPNFGEACFDYDDTNCQGWAEDGDCASNPNIGSTGVSMQVTCQASCGICTETVKFTVANSGGINVPVTTLKDLDGDGDLDMFVGDSTGSISYYENAGAKTNPAIFTARTGAGNPMNGLNFQNYAAPHLVDFDNDGDYDLFVGNSPNGADGFIFYYENTGSSTNPVFTARVGNKNPMNGLTGFSYTRPKAVDLDGDEDYDMIVASYGGQAIYFETTRRLRSNYEEKKLDGNPLSSVDLGVFYSPALKDMDGDSDSDLILGYSADGIGYLAYVENTGSNLDPIFTQRTGASSPMDGLTVGNLPSPVLEDINNDGDPDMFVGAQDGTIMYFENMGTPTNPTFIARTGTNNPMNSHNSFASAPFASPTLKDINGDGDFDMFIGTLAGNILYYENIGTPSTPMFESKTPMSGLAVSGLTLSRLVLRDVDGDRDFDMFVGFGDGLIHYFENIGNSTSPTFTQRLGEKNPMDGYGKADTTTMAAPTVDSETGLDGCRV